MAHPRLAILSPYNSEEDVKTIIPSAGVHLARGTITAIEPTVIRTHLRTRRGGSTVKACGRGAGGLLERAIVTKTKEPVMRGHARSVHAGLALVTAVPTTSTVIRIILGVDTGATTTALSSRAVSMAATGTGPTYTGFA